MSRIGKKIIVPPKDVEVILASDFVRVTGPKGTVQTFLHPLVKVEQSQEDGKNILKVSVTNEVEKNQKALWGTTRSNIQNLIIGVTQGFKKSLEVIGVGYRVNVQGKKVVLDVGFSHSVEFILPEGITGTVEKNILTLSGIDKIIVGETAAKIRRVRKPEPYGGKGIKYIDEVIHRKAGKAAKTGE